MFSFWNLTSRLASFIKHFLCERAEREIFWRNRDKGQYSKSFSLFRFGIIFFCSNYYSSNFNSKLPKQCLHEFVHTNDVTWATLTPLPHPLSFPFPLSSLLWGTHTLMLGRHHNGSTWTSYVFSPLKPGSRVHTQQRYAINAVNTKFQWQEELSAQPVRARVKYVHTRNMHYFYYLVALWMPCWGLVHFVAYFTSFPCIKRRSCAFCM